MVLGGENSVRNLRKRRSREITVGIGFQQLCWTEALHPPDLGVSIGCSLNSRDGVPGRLGIS
jgi:hypothetical protein